MEYHTLTYGKYLQDKKAHQKEREYREDVTKLSSLRKQYLEAKKKNELQCEKQNIQLKDEFIHLMKYELGVK